MYTPLPVTLDDSWFHHYQRQKKQELEREAALRNATSTTAAPLPTVPPTQSTVVTTVASSEGPLKMKGSWEQVHPGEIWVQDGGWIDDVVQNINSFNSSVVYPMNNTRRSWQNWNEHTLLGTNKFIPPDSSKGKNRMKINSKIGGKSYYNLRGGRTLKSRDIHEEYGEWVKDKSHRDRRELYRNMETAFR